MAGQNVEIAKKGYAAFAAGDLETVHEPTSTTTSSGSMLGNSTVSGTYRGKDRGHGIVREGGRAVLYNNAPSRFLADDDDRGRPHPSHRRRRIRTPSRCVHLPRRQSRQSPELRGHCHGRNGSSARSSDYETLQAVWEAAGTGRTACARRLPS